MTTLSLVYQTEPGCGTPRLRATAGGAAPLTEAELRELEAELARQYPDLIRGKVPAVTFRDRQLAVSVRSDERTRQPTVVLTQAGGPTAPAADWLAGLLADLDRLPAGEPGADAMERAMLGFAVEQFRSSADGVGRSALAGLLLAGHLAAVAHTARDADPKRATVYDLALAGLEKRLAGVGTPPAAADPPRGPVARLTGWLVGRPPTG